MNLASLVVEPDDASVAALALAAEAVRGQRARGALHAQAAHGRVRRCRVPHLATQVAKAQHYFGEITSATQVDKTPHYFGEFTSPTNGELVTNTVFTFCFSNVCRTPVQGDDSGLSSGNGAILNAAQKIISS